MTVPLYYAKNLLQLVLSSRKAWEDIALRPLNPLVLMKNGFYPLLALVACSAVAGQFITPGAFVLSTAIEQALVQFLSLFVSYFVARAAMEWMLPSMADDGRGNLNNASVMALYSLSLFGVIDIIDNLCPVHMAVMRFLPAFIIIVAWQARTFLQIRQSALAYYIIMCIVTLVALPLIIEALLNLLL